MKINQGAEPEMRRGCGSEILIRAGGHGGVPEVVQVLKGESRFPPRLATPNPACYNRPPSASPTSEGGSYRAGENAACTPHGGGERGVEWGRDVEGTLRGDGGKDGKLKERNER